MITTDKTYHTKKPIIFFNLLTKATVLVPQWWNKLPTNVRTVESLSIFCKRLKTLLFRLHLDPA